jgi:hypothetical protein
VGFISRDPRSHRRVPENRAVVHRDETGGICELGHEILKHAVARRLSGAEKGSPSRRVTTAAAHCRSHATSLFFGSRLYSHSFRPSSWYQESIHLYASSDKTSFNHFGSLGFCITGGGSTCTLAKAGQGESALGIELAAAVEALWRSLGTDLHVDFWDRLLERYLGNARTALGQAAETARTRGLELPFDDAVERALQDGPGGSEVVATASGP